MVDAPEAVSATLSPEVAHEIARAYDDQVVFPDRILVDEVGSPDRLFPGTPQPVLVIAVENQGVCAWGVPLETPDPVVLVGGDLQGIGDSTVEFAPNVQAYVDARRWDYQCLGRVPLIQAQAGDLTDEAASHLAAHYEQVPSTRGWPGAVQLRYQRGSTQLMLWSADGQCDWWISAGSVVDLEAAVREVIGLPDLAGSLWSNDAEGELLLDRVRDSLPD